MPAAKTAGYIYALSSDGVVKYVGQAKDLKKRYGQHCSLAQNTGKLPRNLWITELLKGNKEPVITSLERTDDIDTAEIKWIKLFRQQGELLNIADGGKSMASLHRAKKALPWGKTHSPTQRILMMLKSDIRTMEKLGRPELAEKIRGQYANCVEAINRVGKDRMNILLWEKEQEKKRARQFAK